MVVLDKNMNKRNEHDKKLILYLKKIELILLQFLLVMDAL